MAKVLLVTADFDTGYRFRSALKRAGHEVSLHFRADDALRVLEHEDVQVLACDPVLPGMFGTELITAARRSLRNAELRAILLQGLPERLKYELSGARPVEILPARSSDALQHAIE